MEPETINQIVNFILVVAIPALAAYLAPLIKEYFKARIEAIKQQQLRQWVWDFVRAAEQRAAELLTNEEKRALVLIQLKRVAHSFGLEISEDQALALLEAAVYMLKQEQDPLL